MECFAHDQVGLLPVLRDRPWRSSCASSGIPARIVEGFLPGERTATGVETDQQRPEPRVGRGLLPGLRLGDVRPDRRRARQTGPSCRPASRSRRSRAAVCRASPCRPPVRRQRAPTIRTRSRAVGHRGVGRPLPAPFIAHRDPARWSSSARSAFVAWQRGPRRGTTADHAYRTVTRLASRFGFGPRPTQTVYEYAGRPRGGAARSRDPSSRPWRGPRSRPPTAGRILGADRLQALREAERRLRVSLLRLAFRRRERRRRR